MKTGLIASESTRLDTEDDVFNKSYSTQLKGVAIIMLIIHHCFMADFRYEGQNVVFVVPESIWNYVAMFFKICVSLFVFISAYGLTKKMQAIPETGLGRNRFLRNYVVTRIVTLLGGFTFVFLLVDIFALVYDPDRFVAVYGSFLSGGFEYFLLDMLGLAELLGTPTFLTSYWYYSLAIVVVLLVPPLYLLLRQLGPVSFLSLIAVINFTVEIPNTDIWRYVLCVAVGVACADGNWITKIVRWQPISNRYTGVTVKFAGEVGLLLVLMVLREGVLKDYLYPLWDAVIPVVTTAFCCEFLFSNSVLGGALSCLGKHSGNIYLVHNFIRMIWFYDFTYSFTYPLIIVTVLLLISLAVSIGIEWLKRRLHYQEFLHFLIRSACQE